MEAKEEGEELARIEVVAVLAHSVLLHKLKEPIVQIVLHVAVAVGSEVGPDLSQSFVMDLSIVEELEVDGGSGVSVHLHQGKEVLRFMLPLQEALVLQVVGLEGDVISSSGGFVNVLKRRLFFHGVDNLFVYRFDHRD